MAPQDVDEESIDTEALQAQIDLSMSFAQDLVSSWLKPSQKLAKTSRKDIQEELNEYMRRPARLGVGAPIPESASMSRETARLKNKLTNKGPNKRVKEEEEASKKQNSDDEEESRAGAIRKKARLDVFGSGNERKKKKKSEVDSISTPPPNPGPAQAGPSNLKVGGSDLTIVDHNMRYMPTELASSSLGPATSINGQKGKPDTLISSQNGTSLRGPQNLPTHLHTHPSSGDLVGVEVTNCTRTKAGQMVLNSPPTTEVFDISCVATPNVPSPIRPTSSQVAAVLKLPILNLGGPADIDDNLEEDDSQGISGVTPKKKRRRRKKKKSSFGSAVEGI